MLTGSLVLLVILAVALFVALPTIMGSKSIWLKDGGKGALKLGNVKAEVGVSYFVSARPEINYLVTQHGEFAAEGKYQAAGMKDAFDIFPRDPAHDNFPYLLTGEVVGNRMKIVLQKRSGFSAG